MVMNVVPLLIGIGLFAAGSFTMTSQSLAPGNNMNANVVTQRRELAKVDSWTPTKILWIDPKPSGDGTPREVAARSVEYIPPGYHGNPYSLVTDPRTRQTYVTRGNQTLYVSQPGGLVTCLLGPASILLSATYVRVPSVENGDRSVLDRFVSLYGDRALDEAELGSTVDLRRGAPDLFFTANSAGGSQYVTPRLGAVEVEGTVMRIELTSDGGKFKGLFWIDLSQADLVRAVVNDVENAVAPR